MDPNQLFVLRYRKGSIGVQTGYLVASTPEKANEVGQAWCNQEFGRKFIAVEKAILADESILPASAAPAADRKAKAS